MADQPLTINRGTPIATWRRRKAAWEYRDTAQLSLVVPRLSHFDVGHDQDTLPIGSDADECVGNEAIGTSHLGITLCRRQAQRQQQASACGCSNLQGQSTEPQPLFTEICA